MKTSVPRTLGTMRLRAFQQVDVFTAVPFSGNPVAVMLDADELSTEQMQAIARWTNLSETTFVCRPTDDAADYRLRIFTPRQELPFAGHPTIGSAHAVLRSGLKPKSAGRLVQECGRGLIELRIDALPDEGRVAATTLASGRVFLRLPSTQIHEPTPAELQAAVDALGISRDAVRAARVIDIGPVWFTLRLADAASVLAIEPDMARLAALKPTGLTGVTIFGLHPPGSAASFEVRSFAPAHGVPEDPVCGSGNGAVATLLRHDDSTPAAYLATQGARVGRAGRVFVRYEGDSVWLGGDAVTCIEGTITA